MLIIYLDEETTVTPEMWKFIERLTSKKDDLTVRSEGSERLVPISPPRRGRPPKYPKD